MPSRNRAKERAKAQRLVAPAASGALADGVVGAVPGRPVHVQDLEGVGALAQLLLAPERSMPVAVISVHSGESDPWIDADAVADAVEGAAPVYVVPNALCWPLAEMLPAMTQVYGGAGRVYPVGGGWLTDPYASPLRFAYSPADGTRSTDLLIGDALKMAQVGGSARASTPVGAVAAVGVVLTLVESSRAVVRLDDGSMAAVWAELVVAGVPLERLLRPGQQVSGLLDTRSRRLDVRGSLVPADQALEPYVPGDAVLAKVVAVASHSVTLAPHPAVEVVVPRERITDSARDALDELFTVGETVVARLLVAAEAGWVLALDDIGEDEDAAPAAALLPGGPAWLILQQESAQSEAGPQPRTGAGGGVAASPVSAAPQTPAVDDAPPREPVAAPGPLSTPPGMPAPELAEARAQVHSLERQVRWLTEERGRLLEQVTAQKRHLLRKVQAAGKARRPDAAAEVPVAAPVAFLDPGEQFRFEVELEWATRVAPQEKADRPLVPWSVGPDFLASVADLEGVSRRTLVRVVVEVLTGLAEQLPGRELHRLRTGLGAGDPYVTRGDGAMCMRVALQRKTASARRLHYWKLGEHIELSRVVVHDDMTP